MATRPIWLALTVLAACARAGAQEHAAAVQIAGGEQGVGLDDMRLDPVTHAVFVPAGVTGTVIAIDPTTHAVTAYPGFAHGDVRTGHNDGATSVDFDAAHLYVADRTSQTIDVVDRATKRTVGRARLAARSDYVRVVPSVRELWVTEPQAQTIEVFDLATLVRKTTISVPGGPECLEIDAVRGAAYTNVWTGARTWSISLTTHARLASWTSGCPDGQTQGIALDVERGQLFVGCEGGTVTALDVAHDGHLLGTVHVNGDVDIISMDVARHHVYVPSETGTLAIVGAAASDRSAECQRVTAGGTGVEGSGTSGGADGSSLR